VVTSVLGLLPTAVRYMPAQSVRSASVRAT
jgi:hypothetical protein